LRAGSSFEDWGQTTVGLIVIALFLVFALLLTPVLLIGVPAYIGIRLYRENPARLERLARNQTNILYTHALAGTVQLTTEEIDEALCRTWPLDTPESVRAQLLNIGRALFVDEGLSPNVPPPPALCNTVEGARYRDALARIGQARGDPVMVESALETISESLAVIARAVPPIDGDVLVAVRQFLEPLGAAVEAIIAPFYAANDYQHFKSLRERLNSNLERTHRTAPIFPRDHKGDDVIDTYLQGTRLKELFALKTPFDIPEAIRFEHMHIVAGTGHGKTQTLQYLIAKDLKDVAQGDKSVIVIDSQGDLLRTILAAKHLPPEKIVLIDPEDIAFPVSLNLFSVGQERMDRYDPLERERLTNSIIELYDFVLGSLLSAGMTSKQNVIFRYVTRLMFHIPNATIHTLRELMEPGGAVKYQSHIDQLDGTARQFFKTEFDGREFTSTKAQVLRRLYGILENRSFERMFSHPKSKFDMFSEMNAGKLILINTAKSLLKEQGTEVFGRFFIALIAQAAQERSTLPSYDRLPCMVYVDEAQDYFDENVAVILSQARKYLVGMVLAHQYLGQLPSYLAEAFEANTAIKVVGGVSARDARAFAGQIGADPELILSQPTGSFATYIRGLTKRAVPMSFPFFVMEKLPRTSHEERDAIRAMSRATYAEPIDPGPSQAHEPDTPEPIDAEPADDDDPLKPSPEL
jgi:Helicase HerA, central domain